VEGPYKDLQQAPRVRPDLEGPLQIEIISVGQDLLRGRVSDSNAPALATLLSQRGARISRITTVGDDDASIAAAVTEALARNPYLLITTGGLGPAPDDRTLLAVGNALGLPLTVHPQAKQQVEEAYKKLADARHLPTGGLNESREKLCRFPVGSTAIPNNQGIVPGMLVRLAGGTFVLCLPGRPHEMKATLNAALPLLREVPPRGESARREIESPTPDEAALRPALERLSAEFPDLWITSHPPVSRKKGAGIRVTVEACGDDRDQVDAVADKAIQRLIALVSGT